MLTAIGSISAALSCPVYPPRKETSGEESRLISRTAAGNRAYDRNCKLLGTFRSGDEDDYEYDYEYEFSVLSMGIRFGGRHFLKCACSEQETRTRSRPRPPI